MTSELKPCPFCGGEVSCTDQDCPMNTRDTPSADTLEGLDRYTIVCQYHETEGYPYADTFKYTNGEYVLHSDVAKIVAVKDGQITDYKNLVGVLHAELAQIKAQVPVAYFYLHGTGMYMQAPNDFKTQSNVFPLYAAPVSDTLKADNERLRKALENANGLLNTPVSRRRYADDKFYIEIVRSIDAALKGDSNDKGGGETK